MFASDKGQFKAMFADKRSHADFAVAFEYRRSLIQTLVAGGGVATTSLLTLAGAFHDHHNILKYIVFPAAGFLCCVVCGVVAALKLAEAHDEWGTNWQLVANEEIEKAEKSKYTADRRIREATSLIKLGLFAFVIGSIVAGALIYVSA